MRLHRSLALTFLTVFAIHCGLIYWLIDYKEKYAEPSMYRLIKVKLSERAPSNKTKATQESKSVSEKDFAEKTSIKTLEELQTQKVHLGSSKNIEFGEFDIQMDEISDIPKPHYPLLSKRLREQGDVLVRSCMGSGGKSNVVTIDKSSGYHRLDQSALDAVKHWKELLKNRIQRSSLRCYRIPIRFRLTGE